MPFICWMWRDITASGSKYCCREEAELAPFIYIHWTEGERVLQVITANSTQYNLTLKDKENISVQFVTVTPKNMLAFESVIFICQVLVTLRGTSGSSWTFFESSWGAGVFFFFPPMMWQVTVKYPTSVGYNFCLTQEERLSQRSVAILNKREEKKKKSCRR